MPFLSFRRPPLRPLPCVLLALSGLGTGCRSSPSNGAEATSTAAAVSAAAVEGKSEPLVIRFSDPGNAGIFAYAKREGILERELSKVGAGLVWVPGPGAFSASFDAMNSGAINTAGGAISPIVGALSHNLRFRIYGISDPGAVRQAGIISPASSSIRDVKDLVGKRVAVNLAAKGDYILLKALANDGVPADQVNRVPIQPPDAAAAFATGKIDAWSTFGVFYSTAVRNGAHVLVTEDKIQSDDVGVLSANVETLEKSPEAYQVIIKVAQDLAAQAHAHPEQFQNVFVDKGPTSVSGDELRIATEETKVLPVFRVPSAADKARIANVAAIFHRNKSIDRELAVDEIVFDVDEAAKAREAKR
jgi:sulfonate transport system substrate-binding protein